MTFSYSRISAFRQCKRQHHFAYVERIKPKKTSRPLSFGGDFHTLLECVYDPCKPLVSEAFKDIEKAYNEATADQQAELGETYLEDLTNVFEDYLISTPDPCLNLIGTEINFEIPLPIHIKGDPAYFVGVIDKLQQDDEGNYILTDYKTFTRQPDSDSLVMNTQSMLYAKAVEILYSKKPTKMVWDYIKSKPADEPIFLEKSQRLSKSFGDKVTLESWQRAKVRYNLIDSLTEEEESKLITNRGNYYFTKELPVIPKMVERMWADYLKTVREIKDRNQNQTMNVTKNCSWCDYQPICLGDCTGADVSYIKAKDYEKRDRK